MIQILFAVLAGILTIGAPCILPVLPIVLGSSIGRESRSRPLFLVLGFISSFVFVSLVFSVITRVAGISHSNLRTLGVVLLLIFGLLLLLPNVFEKIFSFLNRYVNLVSRMQNRYSGNFGGFVVGLTIGIIWAPCAGPVLGSILTLIATTKDLVSAGILLFAYALGAGLPMLLIAYGGQYISTRIKSISKFTGVLQRIFGLLIILLAISMYFNYDLLIQAYIAEHFKWFAITKY